MKKQLTVAFSIVLLLTVTVVASADFLQTADAAKAKGTSLPETGSKKVCGDKLCSEVVQSDSTTGKHSEDKAKHSESSHDAKGKMKQQHLEMLEKMKSMNKMEMIDSMKSMMAKHHDMKIEKMSKMDRSELLKHIEKMLDKMSKDSHDDMDDMYHENSDEKHKSAEHLSKQHLQTFDELDFDVFTNQKWDRLHESHSQNIVVHWPDGKTTVGIEPHIDDLKAMFVWAPDTRIEQHPVKIASEQWTSVIGVIEGTFTEPMPMPDGTTIQPTGKSFKLTMNTVGYWENGVMTKEYLFWDNLEFMKQIGLS